MKLVFFILFFATHLAVFAQEAKRQSLSFEDELVQGATQKPDLSYILRKRNFNYKRLIKLRKNFLPEMRRSSENLHRRRSSD